MVKEEKVECLDFLIRARSQFEQLSVVPAAFERFLRSRCGQNSSALDCVRKC